MTFQAGPYESLAVDDLAGPQEPNMEDVTASIRAPGTPMSDSDQQRVVEQMLNDGSLYLDEELSTIRAVATDYYFGRPFGNEVEGRSQAVSTDVRDTVQAMLPSLLRVFWGPQRVVEFEPDSAGAVAMARQMTDAVRYIIEKDNAGFMHTRDVLKDGLVRKIGIFKWWWETSERVEGFPVSGLDQEQLDLLQAEGDVEVSDIETDPETGLSTAKVQRRTTEGRVRIAALPPEEFLYPRAARTLEDAVWLAHRTPKTISDLVAMGFDEEELRAHAGASVRLDQNVEVIARNPGAYTYGVPDYGEAADGSLARTLYTELYAHIDVDGDGIAELRRYRCVGDTFHILDSEPWDHYPFSDFCPDPEPHTITGQSIADYTMDMQRIKSETIRKIYDSAGFAIDQRTVVLEGGANMADVLNQEIGAVIRERVQGAVRTLEHRFVGGDLLPLMAYADDVIERRTGQNKGAAGLDADALQSSTKQAVNAAVTMAQQHLELIARIFAERTMKPLFRGVLRLLVQHQNQPMLMKLGDNYEPVDPRSWNADLKITVNVGLGTTLTEDRLNAYMMLLAKQEQIIQLYGPNNQLVTPVEYRRTLATLMEHSGVMNVSDFIKELTEQQWQAFSQQQAQQEPPPTPEEVLGQAQVATERMKIERDFAIKQAELVLEREKLQQQAAEAERKAEIDRQKMLLDFELKKAELEAKTQADFDLQRIKMEFEQQKLMVADAKARQAMDQADDKHLQSLQQRDEAHAQQLEQQRAATAATSGDTDD